MSDPLHWPRRTLAQPATVRGITLFTAVQAEVVIRPTRDGGLRFVSDSDPSHPIPANVAHAVNEPRRTVLQLARGPSVQTVEHILSALLGFGVTDAAVELTGPELPIGDGSASPFAKAIAGAGLVPLDAAPIAPIAPAKPLTIAADGASVRITPRDAPGCSYTYHLDYGPDSPIRPQEASFTLPPGGDGSGYAADVAPARTFSTLPEAIAFRQMGLFAHLGPAEMLVIGPEGPVDNTLRFDNEPARHKLLDLIGDLALAGRPIQADIVASRSGHALNRRAAAALAVL